MSRIVLPAALAAAIVALALDGGAFGLESRATLAIGVWWAVLVGVAAGVVPVGGAVRPALLTGALLVAFAALTAISAAWSDSAEKTIAEFNRVALYVGVFVLAAFGSRRRDLARWSDGLAAGIALVAAVALGSRLFPALGLEPDIPRFLPGARNRLSYPVGYWNGLAVLTAMGVPLLLRAAVHGVAPWRRGLAAGALPALAATIFLTSSRGGTAAAITAIAVLLALAADRLAVVGALLAAGAGSAVVLAVLVERPALVDGPLASTAAREQGRTGAVLLILVCAATGLAYALGSRFVSVGSSRARRALGATVAASATLAVGAAVVTASPVSAFDRFREPPSASGPTGEDAIAGHLLSGGGSGRWQFWTAAVEAFETRPILGRGAGSYEAWWAQHGTLSYFVRNAHSLYLEVLAELGALGLVLLGAAFATGIAAGTRRALGGTGEARSAFAALTASFAAFVVAAAVDWVWELTIVGVLGAALLGLLVGGGGRAERAGPSSLRPAGRALVAALALGVFVCQALPLLAATAVRESQEALRRGDADEALSRARDARDLQPWAASGHAQLALVEEEAGDVRSARRDIRRALARDPADWRLWLVAARLDVKAGEVAAARRSLARAKLLNPRSPLFAKDGV